MSSNISVCNVLDTNKLTKTNFLDWYRNVKIILNQKLMLYVLENLIPLASNDDVDEEVRNEYQCHINDDEHVACVMLASITPELQR